MTDRRTFLKGAAAVGALAIMPVMPRAPWSMRRPILYGDRIHNDSPALNALFAGKAVDIRDKATHILSDGTIVLDHGTYRLRDTLYIPIGVKYQITNNWFEMEAA